MRTTANICKKCRLVLPNKCWAHWYYLVMRGVTKSWETGYPNSLEIPGTVIWEAIRFHRFDWCTPLMKWKLMHGVAKICSLCYIQTQDVPNTKIVRSYLPTRGNVSRVSTITEFQWVQHIASHHRDIETRIWLSHWTKPLAADLLRYRRQWLHVCLYAEPIPLAKLDSRKLDLFNSVSVERQWWWRWKVGWHQVRRKWRLTSCADAHQWKFHKVHPHVERSLAEC